MLNKTFSNYAHITQLQPKSVPDTVPALRLLISDIRDALPGPQKHFLKDRTEEQLVWHFAKGNLAFGAMKGDELIGCVLMSDLSDPEFQEFNAMNYGSENLTRGNWAVHTVGVHPDHMKRGLMKSMLDTVFAHAAARKYDNLIAKVADANASSRTGFLRADFVPSARGIDHAGGYPFTLFSRQVAPALAPEPAMPLNAGHGRRSLALAFSQ